MNRVQLQLPSRQALHIDPRLYQIAILPALLVYGMARLQFEIGLFRIAGFVGLALATQYGCGKLCRLPRFGPRSPLVSALSFLLLLRFESAVFAAVAIVIAIASKFILRWRGKHLFNPTNGVRVFLG